MGTKGPSPAPSSAVMDALVKQLLTTQKTYASNKPTAIPAIKNGNNPAPGGPSYRIVGNNNYYGVPTNANAKTYQYVNSANRLNQIASRLDGQPTKPNKQSVWSRIGDVLSRGMYGTAEASKRNIDQYNESRHEGHGILSSLGSGFVAGLHGEWAGLSGKKKTSFSDTIQNYYDVSKAAREQKNSGKPLQVTKDSAKVNGFLKHGVGVLGDILGDPTSYVGVGLIKELAHAKDLVKAGEDAAKVAKKFAGTAGYSEQEIKNYLAPAIHVGAPANATRQAKATQQSAGFITDMAEARGAAAAKTAQKNVYRKTPLGQFPEPAAVSKAMERAAAKQQKATATHLTEILARNTHPETSKALQLRIAGNSVGALKAPEILSKANAKLLSAPPIKAGLDVFHKGFQSASGRLDPALHQLQRTHAGRISTRLVGHVANINSVYGVDKATRQRVWDQAAAGHFKSPIEGGNHILATTGQIGPVGNLAKHFNDRIATLAKNFHDENLGIGEWNSVLPKSLASKDDHLHLKAPEIDKKTGQPKNPNWLRDQVLDPEGGWAKKLGKDPGKALYLLEHAHINALEQKYMHNAIAKTFGVQAGSGGADALKKQGYREVLRKTIAQDAGIPYHQGVLYHPEIAKHIEALHEMSRERKTVIPYLDHGTQIFKKSVTAFVPGFHSRNLLGEMMNSYMAGVKNPAVYKHAAKVLAGRDKQFLLDPTKDYSRAVRRATNASLNDPSKIAASISQPGNKILSNLRSSGRRRFTDVDSDYLSGDLLHHAFNDNGINSGFVASDLANNADPVRGGKIGRIGKAANEGVTNTAQAIENYTRMAHFIDAINKSKAPTFAEAAKEAAQVVRKYHFDYNDFSNFEKNWASRAIPFYKWTRKNLPLMTEMMLSQPGKAIAPYKLLNEASRAKGFQNDNNSPVPQADSIFPQYLKDAMAVPIGHHGKGAKANTIYANPAIPFGQAFQMFGGAGAHGITPRGIAGDTAMNLGQMTNPLLKDFYELATGQRVGGAKISDKKKYLLSQNPFTNVGQRLSVNQTDPSNTGLPPTQKGKFNWSDILSDPAFLQMISGAGLAENTPKSMQSAAKQIQQQAIDRRKAALKKKGIKGNPKP